jgi:glycosyltransferase involved in cell wall biosynthesis
LQPRGSFQKLNKNLIKNIFDIIFGYKIIKNASKIILTSKNECKLAKKLLDKIKVDESKICYIPNGIDTKLYKKISIENKFREKYLIDKTTRIILYLGRIHEVKGLDFLVKSFYNLVFEQKNLKLVIIGPNSGYKSKLKKIISKYDLTEYILLLDGLFDDEKLSAYSSADVFVLPSKQIESFGNAALESVACGIPTVVTNVCGISDWMDNLIIVDPSSNSIKNGIIKALSKDGKKIGEKGKIESKKFDWKKISNTLLVNYEKIL